MRWINFNMRCFEIDMALDNTFAYNEINFNMRCFEIKRIYLIYNLQLR